MPNEFDTNKNQLDLFSYAESKQNQQDKRQKLASSGFTATVWTLSGVVLAACSLFEDDEGLGGGSVSVNASPVRDARLYFDIDGDGDVDENDVRIQNEQYPGGFTTDADGRATGIPIELLGRPYIALLDGAVDDATEQELEGQYSSLEDEDGNHLIASPITDLIADAIADTNQPNTVPDVVAEFTPSGVDADDILAELRNRDSYLPNTDDYSPRIVAVSKYLADNQAREVLGREDDLNTQIMEVERILGEVTTPDALIIVSEDSDNDPTNGVQVEMEVGEHDTYIGLVNAVSGDNTLTFRFVNANGDEMEVPGYTINPRGVISAVTPEGETSPTNTATMPNTPLRISVSDGTNTEIVEVAITVQPAYELVIVQEDATEVVATSVDVEENDMGAMIAVVIRSDEPATQHTDFEIRDDFPDSFNILADKFMIEAVTDSPGTFNLRLKTGEYLDYEAFRTFDLHISALESGTPSNELTITVMVGNVDDISFSGGLRADLTEDGDVQANDELISEGNEVTIANNLDANGNPLPVGVTSDGVSNTATDPDVTELMLTYGTFTYDHTANTWSYVVNNDAANVQALLSGNAVTEIVDLEIVDAGITYTQSIVLNVHGANEEVHYVDAITGNRVDGSDANIETGDPAINGMLDLGNIFDGLRVENQLPGSTPPTVAFAETENAEVLARQNLFTLTPDGDLVFVGNDDDVANLLHPGIALDLVISAPDDTNEPIPFRLSINVVNDDDNGDASYEIMGSVELNGELRVERTMDDPDGIRGTESYQWFRGDETNPNALLGNGPTYTVTAADLASGDTIGVIVEYTDGSNTPERIVAFASPVSIPRPAAADLLIDEGDASWSVSFTATSEDASGVTSDIASYEFVLDGGGTSTTHPDGFTISQTGQMATIRITSGTTFDFDAQNAQNTYNLRVRATDSRTPDAESATRTLTININDVNDNAPVFDPNQVTTVAIDETLGNGQSVGLSVAATDADGTTANSTVTYSVTGGTGMGIFDVDSSSGVITVLDASMIDYESGTTSYTLIIGASDGLDASGTDDPTFTPDATTTITINISDVNDIVPTYTTSGSPSVRTTADPAVDPLVSATPTGYSITITDADAGNDFEGNFNLNDPRFEFQDQGNGVWNLVLRANQDITEEAGDTITLTYQVHDGTNIAETNPPAQPGTVTIAVVDSSVSFDAGFDRDYDIPETTSYTAGELVVQVSATSVTPGNPDIRYSFEQGNPDNALFNIDATTGRITWAANTAFDYEALTADERIGQVVVIATEVAGSGDTNAGTGNTARVTITGTVINEQEGDGTYIIQGNVAAGAELTAEVNDPDGTRSVTYEWYSIDPANSNARTVLGATQSITLPDAANFDDSLTYHVDIVHIDNLGDRHEETLDASAVQFNIQKTLTDNTAFPSSIVENTDSLPVVVASLDGDTRTATYTFVGGDTITTSGVFTISQSGSTAGAITVNAPSDINFETAQEFNDGSRGYTLNVRATFAEDTTSNLPEVTGDVVVTIIVTDVNEHKPVFATDPALSTGTEEIAEDAANGARVGLFRATDADGSNNDVTYSLDDGGLGVFGIQAVDGTNNWEIYVLDNTRLDFESATKSYTIEITASDGAEPAMTTTEAFTINITDANDNDPVLGAPVWRSTYETSVPENTGSGVHLFTVTATDADTATTPPPTLTYRIVTIDDVAYDSATAIFGINDTTGDVGIALDNALDRETKASHEIVIEAFDEGRRTSNQQTVTVTVGDVNEHKPVLGEPEWVSDYGDNGVPEDAYTGAPLQIFTATATDRDATNNGFSYEIVSVDGVTYDSSTSIFAIRAGRVGITSALDYATAPEIMDDTNTVIGRGHEIVIVAIDNSGTGMRSEPGTITVLVANRDDGPAVFEVSPTQANEDILEVEVDTADPDGLDGTYSYQWFTTTDDGVTQVDISGENGRRFDTSGRTDPAGTVYGVRVEYTDNAGTRYTKDGAGDDEVAPFAVNTTLRFTSSYSITLTDGDASPTLPTFALELNDGTAVTDATYTFATDGNPGDFFALSSAGVLTLSSTYATNGVDFDAITDAQKSFRLLIMAEATSGETAVAPVTVTINDVNDIVPVLSQSGTATPIAENDPGANTGITFTVADDDTVNTITYNVAATTSNANNDAIAALFEVDEASGMLRLAGNNVLDREHDALKASGQISLTITANDGVRNSNTETVTITVTDVNDFDPVFRNGAEHTETISENLFTAGSTVVVSANPARDGDATADNRDLTYSIVSVSGSGSGLFNLTDPKTGRIVLTQALDYETAPLLPGGTTNRGYVIELLVVDQDGGQDTQTLTVVVTDEDDTDPEFGTLDWGSVGTGTAGATARTIDENTAGTLLTIPISDVDTAGGTLAVRIVSGNSVEGGEDLFVFAKNTANTEAELSINPNRVLNYEDGTTHTLVLEVSDGTRTATETVTITVNNINEETPTFTNDPIVTWETGFELGIIPEDTDVSGGRVLVGRVAISDDDGATNFLDERVITIAGAGTKFEIERNTDTTTNGGTLGEGLIYLNAALDREGVGADDAEYDAVKITVTDGSLPAVTSDAFSIFIDDVNEGDPVIAVTGSPASFTERTASGNEATGVTFTISDADTGSTYTSSEIALSGDSRFDFVWDEARQSGTVVLKDTETLDHDAATNPDRAITLTLTVTDPLDASVTDTETITINVGNADDVASEFADFDVSYWQTGTGSGVTGEEHIRTIDEDQGASPILVIPVSDPDTATLTASIQGGSPMNSANEPIFGFGVSGNEAILSVISSRLDYETAPNTYTLVLEVSDGTNTPAATQTVTINVGNVNEHGPAFGTDLVDFEMAFSNGDVLENTTVGTVIGVVDVSDADGDVLTVTVLPGLGATQALADKFEVVYNMIDDQYELKLKTALNLEGDNPDPTALVGLRLRATDGTNSVDSPAADNKQIGIQIRNVDDEKPVLDATSITWDTSNVNVSEVDANTLRVYEFVTVDGRTSGPPANTKLATLAATDPDNLGASITYTVDNGPTIGTAQIFTIENGNELTLNTALDYEDANIDIFRDADNNEIARGYTLTLTATKSGKTDDHEIVIHVANFEDGKAVFAPLTSSGDVTAPAVGDTLTFNPTPTTADGDGDPDAGYTPIWYRADDSSRTGFTRISNTGNTYKLQAADAGKIVGVAIEYTDKSGIEYTGDEGVFVELANVVAADFSVTGGTSGTALQYDASAVDATGTLTYDADSADKVKETPAASDFTISGLEYGTVTIDASGTWFYNVNNTLAAVKALQAGSSLTDTFTIGVPLKDSTSQDVEVVVTINGVAALHDAPGVSLDRSDVALADTRIEILQGGNGPDTIKAGDGGSVIIGGYGGDSITLSEADGVVDIVVYRFSSISTTAWRGLDGADVITNFEYGVDKLILVDVDTDTTSEVDYDAFIDGTTADTAGSFFRPAFSSPYEHVGGIELHFALASWNNGAYDDPATPADERGAVTNGVIDIDWKAPVRVATVDDSVNPPDIIPTTALVPLLGDNTGSYDFSTGQLTDDALIKNYFNDYADSTSSGHLQVITLAELAIDII